jgi:hypothetical protein
MPRIPLLVGREAAVVAGQLQDVGTLKQLAEARSCSLSRQILPTG